MKKRALLLALLMVFCFTLGAFGATKLEWIQVALNSVSVEVNGKPTQASTIIYEGITYVPVSFVARELGATSRWDSVNRKVIITGQTQQSSVSSQHPTQPINLDQPEQPKPILSGYPGGFNREEQKPKKDVKADMEKQLKNIEFDMVSGPIDGTYPVLLMTPQNGTGYEIKRMETSYVFGEPSKLKWQNIEAQTGGTQQRMRLLTNKPKGKLVNVKVILSDGNEQHEFEYDFTIVGE